MSTASEKSCQMAVRIMQAMSPCTSTNTVERLMKACSQELHDMLNQSGVWLTFLQHVQHQLVMHVFVIIAAVAGNVI